MRSNYIGGDIMKELNGRKKKMCKGCKSYKEGECKKGIRADECAKKNLKDR